MDQHTETKPMMLTPAGLAKRWTIPLRTVARWRYEGTGPAYVKLGGAIRYRLTDIEAYEAANMSGQPA